MKRKITAILLVVALAVTLGLVPAASVGASPGPGLVGLWHLDDGTGSTASDSSVAGNDGTLSGGKFGNALSFDGVNDYVVVPDSASLDITGPITLEAWVKPLAIPATGDSMIVSKWNHATAQRSYILFIRNKLLSFHLSPDGTNHILLQAADMTPYIGTWVHVAGTFDGTTAKLYINGVDQSVSTTTTGIYASTTPLYIGSYLPTDLRSFKGLIDEVRISDVARASFVLTSAPSLPEANTVALWHFDESVGLTAEDETGNNDGTINGASWAGPTWNSGMFDGALSFDGTDDIVTIPHSTSLNLDTAITVEAWIYANSLGSQAGIIRKGLYPTDPTRSWGLDINSGKARFFIYDGGTAYIAYSGNVSTGEWHHIVGTYDGLTVDIYLDGDNTSSIAAMHTGDIDTNTNPIVIGKRNGGYFFDGIIDEVRIWDTAYPSLEVSADPTSAYNPVTFEHEITATVDPVLPDGATVGLEVTAGPNVGETDIGETDASGEVTLSYTDTWSTFDGATETDTILIWVDRNWNDTYDDGVDYAIEVTKNWVKLVSLTPAVDFNPIDTEHEVTATISSAVDGITVWFEVQGVNGPINDSSTTTAGVATFTYTGTIAGEDTITAYFDTDGEDDYDIGEPMLQVKKYYLVNFVTGGGKIGPKKAAYTFAGTVGNLENGSVGQFQIVDHTGKKAVAWHCNNDFSSLVFSGSAIDGPPGPDATHSIATFTGTFTNNRNSDEVEITVEITDVNEPGKGWDTISISSTGPDVFSQTIDGGNFQVHDLPDDNLF